MKHEKKTEQSIEQELSHNLDDLLNVLERIPPFFEREYELAKEFDLKDYQTAKNLFRDTKIQLSLIRLLASSMSDKLRRLRQNNKLTRSYSLHLHLDCLRTNSIGYYNKQVILSLIKWY